MIGLGLSNNFWLSDKKMAGSGHFLAKATYYVLIIYSYSTGKKLSDISCGRVDFLHQENRKGLNILCGKSEQIGLEGPTAVSSFTYICPVL